jgi:hypothetical protein
MKDEQRMARILEYVSGRASAEGIAELEAALKSDPEFREYFLEYLNVDGALGALGAQGVEGEMGVGGELGKVLDFPAVRRRASWWSWGKVAAVAAFAGIALSGWALGRGPYATVCSSVGNELRAGLPVRADRFRFERGAVEFLTAKGARLVVEAPADVRFESRDSLRVYRGKVAADVPEGARGFTVLTPDGGAVDLGTRFGVDVSGKGVSEVHVFQGEVVAQAQGTDRRRSVRTGEATSLQGGTSETRGLRSASFIQPEEVPELAAGLAAGQRARSDRKWAELKRDPALVAAFDFEGGKPFEGVFSMAQGRWPGSRAPEFVNVGDHLKVNEGAGRELAQLTLAAWVRIDRLGEPYQSLYHTDGWSAETPGQVHWMLTQATTMRLALRGNTVAPNSSDKHGFPDSRSPVLPERGRWVHLVTVYDAMAKTVRFYLNGRFDSESRQEVAHPAKLGAAQIGNWNRTDRKLSGRVDELVLLGRAMGDEEVRELYEAGNPYR